MKITKQSLELIRLISDKINNQTFHHHYHILYDIANSYTADYLVEYVEIGCYAGGSACLMLQRPNTNVTSIDLGNPILPDVVYSNVKKLNKFNNEYSYIQGNSSDETVISQINKDIDILFIDGDHSYSGVINDFNNFSKHVKTGGYIVFDDYHDLVSSPGVYPAVNDIIKSLSNYEIIGTIKNTLDARGYPADFKEGNCFIIKKL